MKEPAGAYRGKEDDFQRSAMVYVRTALAASGHDRQCAMHVPNGGQRSPIVGAKLKDAGVVPGYPDIMVFLPQTLPPINRRREVVVPRCGLAIELKVWPKKPSKQQEHIHELLRWSGWHVVTCWSIDAVISEVKAYLGQE